MWARPNTGSRWCSQKLSNSMSRRVTRSALSWVNVRARCSAGSSRRPPKSSAQERATRAGVSSSPSRSGSSPIAISISRTAFSRRGASKGSGRSSAGAMARAGELRGMFGGLREWLGIAPVFDAHGGGAVPGSPHRSGARSASARGWVRLPIARSGPPRIQELPMTISVGDRLPEGTLWRRADEGVQALPVRDVFAGRRVLLFAVPGAFTPTCSDTHLPGYVMHADELKAKVDAIACVAVNDAHVMRAWSRANHAEAIEMLADGNCDWTRALGLTLDLTGPGPGIGPQRNAPRTEDGALRRPWTEPARGARLSGAEAV